MDPIINTKKKKTSIYRSSLLGLGFFFFTDFEEVATLQVLYCYYQLLGTLNPRQYCSEVKQ